MTPLGLFSGGFLIVAGAALCWAAAGSSRVLHPVQLLLPAVPSDLGLAWEPVHFPAADGTPVSAWLIRHPQPAGLLLMFHGFGSSKADLLDVAAALHRAGRFSALLMDFRGHGQSGRAEVTFGLRELQEIEAALRLAASDPGLKGLPVGCWGVSMGGAIALLAAARFPRILGTVADSAYADAGKAIARAQWLTYHIPRFPLGQFVIWAIEFRLRCRLFALNPVQAAERIGPRALFLIHGGRDETIPHEEGLALYRAAREPKRWWLIPEAEHASCFYERTEEYVQKVTEFFRDAFLRAS